MPYPDMVRQPCFDEYYEEIRRLAERGVFAPSMPLPHIRAFEIVVIPRSTPPPAPVP